jgi:hypothetical protein
MRRLIQIAALVSFVFAAGPAAAAQEGTLYKNPSCGCCTGYADHLKGLGYSLKVVEVPNMTALKRRLGVAERQESCHTMEIGGYVVEGHVPPATLGKLLKEKPPIKGIALPGMPIGTPGMEGPKSEPFVVEVIGAKAKTVYAVE